MNSALKLKLKSPQYAGGGITSLMKKAKTRTPRYAEGSSVVNQYTSNVPEYAKDEYAGLVGKAQALTDQAYNPYGGRQAAFSGLQNQGFSGLAALAPSQYSTQAAGLAGQASQQALNSQYGASGFNTWGNSPLSVQAGAGPQQVQGPGAIGNVSGPGAAQQVQGPNMGLAGQVSGPGGPSQVGTQSFLQPGAASSYMNPYMQNVVDVQQREAVRADDVARGSRNAQAVGAGAFGGSRQAIQEAEANRNLQTHLGDIQATGSNAAYQQAQQQFNTEQGQSLAAQQANQQAGLTTAGMSQQAKLANQQTGLAGLQLGQQAQQANQQAGLTTAQMGQQAALANQQTAYGLAGLNQQAQQANQQAGLTYGSQSLAAQQANQQAGLSYGNQYLQAQQQAEQSRQFGANYGLQGLQTGLQGATALSGMGSDIYKQQQNAAASQITGGTQQQQTAQSILDQQYNDYLRQQNTPYQQLGFMSDILHGTQGTSSTAYGQSSTQTPNPSTLQTLAGLGTTAYGLSKMAGGGAIDGGLASIAPDSVGDFADGGIVGFYEGTDDEGIQYEGARSTNPAAGYVTGRQAVNGVKAGTGALRDTMAAAQSAGMYGAPEEIQAAYTAAQEARAAAAHAKELEATAKATAKAVKAAGKAPSILGATGALVGGAARGVAGKLPVIGAVAAPAIAGYETWDMTPEQRERMLWMEPDPNRSAAKKAATAIGAFGYNLGNDMLFGLPDRLRDRKAAPAAAAPAAAAAAKPDDVTQIDRAAALAASGGGGASGRFSLGTNLVAPKARTIEELRQSMKDAGLDLAGQEKLALDKVNEVGGLRTQAAKDEEADVAARQAKAGIAGLDREQRLKANREKLPGESALKAGLAILTAKPGGSGWRGALAPIAAGAQGGVDHFLGERAKYDDAMDRLMETRRQEDIANGKEKAAARTAVRAAEIAAKEAAGNVLVAAGVQKNITLPQALWSAADKERTDEFKNKLDVAKLRSAEGIASLHYGALGGAGGGKPLTPAQFLNEVGKRTKMLMAANLTDANGKLITDATLKETRAKALATAEVKELQRSFAAGVGAPLMPEGQSVKVYPD